MSLPLLRVCSLYAGSLPHVTDNMVDISVIESAIAYAAANHMFAKGYIDSANGCIKGFKHRMQAFKFWLFSSATCVMCSALQQFGGLKI